MAYRKIGTRWDESMREDIDTMFKELFDEYIGAGSDAAEAKEKAEQALTDALLAKDIAKTTRDEMLAIIREQTDGGDLVPEITQARGGHEVLGDRLNSSDQELAQTTAEAFRKKDLEDLTPRVLSAIEGGEDTEFNLLSIPQDLSVTPEKTTFVKTEKNKFDGNFLEGMAARLDGSNLIKSDSSHRYCAILRIQDGETLTVTKYIGGNRFNILLVDEYPTESNLPIATLYSYLGNQDNTRQSHTFTNDMGAKYLVVQTNSGVPDIPKVQVEEGVESTDYEKYGIDIPELTESIVRLQQSKKNIFNGDYFKGWLIRGEWSISLEKNDETFNGRTAIVPIQPNEEYTVSLPEGGHDRFVIVIANEEPEIGYIADTHIYEGYSSEFDPDLKEYTFSNTPEGKYVLVYVSTDGSEPKLQVEQGGIATEFEPPKYIPRKYLPTIEQDKVSNEQKKYTFSDDLVGTYDTTSIKNLPDPVSAQTEDVYDLYDQLQMEFSNYISTKRNWGDVEGEGIFSYTFKPHTLNSNKSVKIPKITLFSGTHGNEKNTVYSLYNFMSKICNEWRENKILEFFRFNFEFVVVPIVNPIGFNNGTRANGNGIDLNRNFPTNSTNITSNLQPETKVVMQLLKEHDDSEFVVDYHRMFFRDGYMSYGLVDNEKLSEITNKTINTMGRKWQKDYEFFPQEENHKFGYTAQHIQGSLAQHAELYGIRSLLLEMVEAVKWQDNWSLYDDLTVLTGTELLANILKSMVKIINEK